MKHFSAVLAVVAVNSDQERTLTAKKYSFFCSVGRAQRSALSLARSCCATETSRCECCVVPSLHNAFAIHAKGLATIVPTASMSSGHSDSHLTGMRTTGRKGQGFLPQTGCLVHLQLGPDTKSLTNIQKNKIGSDTTGFTV